MGPPPGRGIEAHTAFSPRHAFTCSGHASACAAALANLAIIRREGLVVRAHHVGARLRDGLQALASDGVIDHTRGDGAQRGAVATEAKEEGEHRIQAAAERAGDVQIDGQGQHDTQAHEGNPAELVLPAGNHRLYERGAPSGPVGPDLLFALDERRADHAGSGPALLPT